MLNISRCTLGSCAMPWCTQCLVLSMMYASENIRKCPTVHNDKWQERLEECLSEATLSLTFDQCDGIKMLLCDVSYSYGELLCKCTQENVVHNTNIQALYLIPFFFPRNDHIGSSLPVKNSPVFTLTLTTSVLPLKSAGYLFRQPCASAGF